MARLIGMGAKSKKTHTPADSEELKALKKENNALKKRIAELETANEAQAKGKQA